MDDQRRMLLVTVLNHERDILELVRLSIRLELIGDLIGQGVEYLNRFLCHILNSELRRLCNRKRTERAWGIFQNHLQQTNSYGPLSHQWFTEKKTGSTEGIL